MRKGCEVKTVRYFDLFFILNRKQNKQGAFIKDIVGKKNKRDVTLQLSTICNVTLILLVFLVILTSPHSLNFAGPHSLIK